jgi:trimethylamine corrinoid protein
MHRGPGIGELQYRFERAMLALDRFTAERLLAEACGTQASAEVVETIVAPALEHIGKSWEAGFVALSQVYMSGRLCEDVVGAFLPVHPPLEAHRPRIAIATLEDFHLLGKRMVLCALRASGFAVRDFGRGTAEELAARAAAEEVDILLLSTLMISSALRVRAVRSLVAERRPSARLVVGGAPFRLNPELAAQVGADAVGHTSADAIAILRGMTGRGQPCP